MTRDELLASLDNVINMAKIYLNENEIPEARKALNNVIKIAEKMHEQAAKQDGNHSDRADQGTEQPAVDAAAAYRDGGRP